MGKCHLVYSEVRHKMEDMISYEFTLGRPSTTGKKYTRNSAH